MPLSKYFDPQPQPTDQTSCPRCEQALHLKSERYFFTKLHTFPLILILPMSQDLFCCIKGDIGAARLTICRTSGSCLQMKSSRRKLFGVDDSAERYHVASVHSGCLFSFASSCQQTVAGESAPCRERNHTEKINDWTFVVFCSASLLICTEGGQIYCVLNIALNIYSNAWFTHGIGAIMFLQGNARFGLLLCSQVSGYTHFHIPSVCRPALKWRRFCKILSC